MVSYISPIDVHVHLRGEEYPNHNFLELAFRDANAVGLAGIIEQPNPQPQLTTEEAVKKRKEQVELYKGRIHHGIHIGLTNFRKQVESALTLVMQGKYGLASDKIFYVHSTGNMGILDPDYQREIWMLKGKIGYKGVSIGHHEDEHAFTGEFDYHVPESHSLKQNPESELIQVERQIRNAWDAKFKGTFYIAHVSNPETARYIQRIEEALPFKVIMEATFHHPLLNTEDYNVHGNRVKMNPPLRSPQLQEELLEYFLNGTIDVLGTDHAPHDIEKKDSENPPSGIPVLPFWPKGIQILRKAGIRETLLEDMIFHNANNLFNLGLKPRTVEVEYNPQLWEAYGYNPFSRIDG